MKKATEKNVSVPPQRLQSSIPASDQGQRLERWIKKHFKVIPYGVLQKWFRQGLVRLDGQKARAETIIPGACTLDMPFFNVHPTDPGSPQKRPQGNAETLDILKKAIVFQDAAIVILNKPAGLATQGGSGQRDYLDLYMHDLCPDQEEPLRLVHRLDQDTSGLLILAKTYGAAKELTQDFKERRIEKTYVALVVGCPSKTSGILTAPLVKKILGKGSKMALAQEGAGEATASNIQSARTTFRLLKTLDNGLSLLELKPHTGRTHQLRVHCAQALGCPILGDGLYGGTKAHPLGTRTRLYLHAAALTLKNGAAFQAFPDWYNAALQGDFLPEA